MDEKDRHEENVNSTLAWKTAYLPPYLNQMNVPPENEASKVTSDFGTNLP